MHHTVNQISGQAWHPHNEGLPGQLEQEEAYLYCIKRKLPRPETNFLVLLKWFLLLELVAISIALFFFLLNLHTEILSFLSPGRFGFIYFYELGNIIAIIVFHKKIFIIMIELYQRYAPENVRRNCMFKPTCSEYAILALRKYNTITALYKIYDRLFLRCKGMHYSIDYP